MKVIFRSPGPWGWCPPQRPRPGARPAERRHQDQPQGHHFDHGFSSFPAFPACRVLVVSRLPPSGRPGDLRQPGQNLPLLFIIQVRPGRISSCAQTTLAEPGVGSMTHSPVQGEAEPPPSVRPVLNHRPFDAHALSLRTLFRCKRFPWSAHPPARRTGLPPRTRRDSGWPGPDSPGS